VKPVDVVQLPATQPHQSKSTTIRTRNSSLRSYKLTSSSDRMTLSDFVNQSVIIHEDKLEEHTFPDSVDRDLC